MDATAQLIQRIAKLETILATHAHKGFDGSKDLKLKGVRTYQSSVTSVAQSAFTALAFQVNSFDDMNLHSTTTNTTRITFPISGMYLIGGQYMAPNTFTLQALALQLKVNGATVIAQNGRAGSGSTAIGAISAASVQIVTLYTATAGDYVELNAAHNTAGAANTSGDSNTFFWATKVGN